MLLLSFVVWFVVLNVVLEVLCGLGVESVELMYGWSFFDFFDMLEFVVMEWQIEEVMFVVLFELLWECVWLGFCLGWDDLFLMLIGGVEFKLCYEGDLYLCVEDELFVVYLVGCLVKQGISLICCVGV